MFDKVIDDFRKGVSTRVQLTSLVALAGLSFAIFLAFLCAAGFVYMHQTYGLIEACFAGAATFFLVTILIGGIYMSQKAELARAAEAARVAAKEAAAKDRTKSALQTALTDPLVLATGLQVVRTVGIRRLIPLLAVSGIALGLWANHKSSNDNAAKK